MSNLIKKNKSLILAGAMLASGSFMADAENQAPDFAFDDLGDEQGLTTNQKIGVIAGATAVTAGAVAAGLALDGKLRKKDAGYWFKGWFSCSDSAAGAQGAAVPSAPAPGTPRPVAMTADDLKKQLLGLLGEANAIVKPIEEKGTTGAVTARYHANYNFAINLMAKLGFELIGLGFELREGSIIPAAAPAPSGPRVQLKTPMYNLLASVLGGYDAGVDGLTFDEAACVVKAANSLAGFAKSLDKTALCSSNLMQIFYLLVGNPSEKQAKLFEQAFEIQKKLIAAQVESGKQGAVRDNATSTEDQKRIAREKIYKAEVEIRRFEGAINRIFDLAQDVSRKELAEKEEAMERQEREKEISRLAEETRLSEAQQKEAAALKAAHDAEREAREAREAAARAAREAREAREAAARAAREAREAAARDEDEE